MTRSRKWTEGYDDRCAVMRAAGVDRETCDRVLDALFDHVFSNVGTQIVGAVKFEWVPCRGRNPDGKGFSTRSLRVRVSRSVTAPAKDVPVIGTAMEEI